LTALSYLEIDAEALRHNFQQLASLAATGTKIAAVVKANAYGHGLRQVVEALGGLPDYYQVDDIEELRELRGLTPQPALVLGYIAQQDIEEAVALDGEIGVWDMERLSLLNSAAHRQNRKVRVHVKVDALLGRLGVLPDDLPRLISEINSYSELVIAGYYGHFANIEDTTDLIHAQSQVAAFEQALHNVPPAPTHMSATSGLMTIEQHQAHDLVRVGVGLYGIYPSAPLARSFSNLALRPALRWVSHLAQVKVLPKGHPVGYGLTFITPREMPIGIVPQGYSDGYDRGLSNSGEVLVRGRRCPVLGRIAMNMFAIDLSAIPDAKPEEQVVLLGSQENDQISAEEIALRTNTIAYEVLARISAELPRVLV
jgi:alanine racemase